MYDSQGDLITAGDDIGETRSASRIGFNGYNNPESDEYFLTAGAYNDAYTGSYSLEVETVDFPDNFFSAVDGYGHADASRAFEALLGHSLPNTDALEGNLWGLDNISAPDIWAASRNFPGTMGENAIVAVVDTGVDLDHPEFSGRIISGYDFVDSDEYADDGDGHGTHVAGTIAASYSNGEITGVAPRANIMPIRVLDDNGDGYSSDIVAGILWAAENGADVINLSLGGSFSAAENEAIEIATEDYGAVVVMAAGNESELNPGWPAAIADQWGIAVGAVNQDGNMAGFSCLAGTSTLEYVTAPGVDIYSAIPEDSSDPNDDLYDFESGTSMAAPHVAGIAVLLKSYDNNLSPTRITDLITGTSSNNLGQPQTSLSEPLHANAGHSSPSIHPNDLLSAGSIEKYKHEQISDRLIGKLSGSANEREAIKHTLSSYTSEAIHITPLDSSNLFARLEFKADNHTNKAEALKELLSSGYFDYFEVDQPRSII